MFFFKQLNFDFVENKFVGNVSSGVAKPGHTGARAPATGGCAPPVQALLKIIRAECRYQSRIGH